ncbi:MAG: hypothetical protein HKP58_12415 [Desulfatitalea sp.]|nr:hypothetical protein [Desulfatitalea sp.]NNK01205.1 hypothetical protein [Desulfatitalea sp.]
MIIATIIRQSHFFHSGAIGIDPMDNELVRGNLLTAINPYDESALNMALYLKEHHPGVHIIGITPRAEQAQAFIDQAISLGADEGVILDMEPTDAAGAEQRAKQWSLGLKTLDFQLLLLGVKEMDRCEDEFGIYLGAHLNLPVISGIKTLTLTQAGEVQAVRKLEKGHGERVSCRLPAVLTAEATGRYRYPTLKSIAQPKNTRVIHIPAPTGDTQEKMPAVALKNLRPPKVRPKKGLVEVDSSLSVTDKLSQLFSGGVTEKKGTGDILTGAPDQVAKTLVAHMQDKGFI